MDLSLRPWDGQLPAQDCLWVSGPDGPGPLPPVLFPPHTSGPLLLWGEGNAVCPQGGSLRPRRSVHWAPVGLPRGEGGVLHFVEASCSHPGQRLQADQTLRGLWRASLLHLWAFCPVTPSLFLLLRESSGLAKGPDRPVPLLSHLHVNTTKLSNPKIMPSVPRHGQWSFLTPWLSLMLRLLLTFNWDRLNELAPLYKWA